MVLFPLEFSECYLDSPLFRENIQKYEEELENTNSQIKRLIKDAKNMLNAFVEHGKMVQVFSKSLQEFQFDCIGEKITDMERVIAGSLYEFGVMLEEVTDEWTNTIDRLNLQVVNHLEVFREENIGAYREARKKFEKRSERYYKQLDNTLGLSHKKKDHLLAEADNELLNMKRSFHEGALSYVDKLQEVEERKKFEFVEHLLMFMQVYFNYFHQTHETASDCKYYMNKLQRHLVNTREQYQGTREKTELLMKKMAEQPDLEEHVHSMYGSQWSRAGYLMLLEKNQRNLISPRLHSKWTKHFCMYMKEGKVFQMVPFSHVTANSNSPASNAKVFIHSHLNSSNNNFTEWMVKTCTRRMTDSLDRRFCFDLELEDKSGKQQTVTLQATSDEDRQKWMRIMDGREPEYVLTKVKTNKEDLCKLNDLGLQFIKNVIREIERRGLDHEGLYRLVGLMSRVDLLLQNALNAKTANSVNYKDEDEWETNTLTSALKSYFRNLPEPIMTFDLHRRFIDAAKCEKHEDRVKRVFELVTQLPDINRKMLSILSEHLENVQKHRNKNKMSIANLGVCFGPTLMRERQETVQAILEIKFSNIIVEILIEERRFLFGGGLMREQEIKSPELNENSPKMHHFNKLPSQRFKERPVGTVYTLTSLPNILENQKTTNRSPDKSKFHRKAVRDHRLRSPSRAYNYRESPNSSDDPERNEIYEEICNEDVTSPPPVHSSDGDLLDSGQNPCAVRDLPPNLNVKSSSCASGNSQAPLGNGSKRNSSKVRISPRFRRNRLSSNKDTPFVTARSHNSNNSNTKPTLPVKPKGLANSLKRRKSRIVTSVRDGLPPHSNISKKALKKVLQKNENSHQPVSNKIAVSGAKFRHAGLRRPRSEFIPTAFQVEESDLQSAILSPLNGHGDSPSRVKSSSFRSRTSDASSGGRSRSFTGSDFTDDELTSTVARTLFACYGDQESELSFRPGQLLRDLKKSNEPGWLVGNLNGKVGLVPRNYIAFV